MATLQQQARALGDPTRYAIFRYVADVDRPVDIAELTEHVGLHHNAVRQHLAKLVAAELLVGRTATPTGPGRPRLRYVTHPAAESRWGVTGSYERLSLLLSEVIRTGDSPVEVGRRAGRRLEGTRAALTVGSAGASDVAEDPDRDDDPLGRMIEQMARSGFEPEVAPCEGGVDVTLQTCAFASAALSDPDTVCALHLGIAQGVAESVGGVTVDELVLADPRSGSCHLHCHVDDGCC